VAVGNGTAGRETEAFVKSLSVPGDLPVIMVNESGASVYSASEAARREFPDLDVTYRGAVSIGRRLMDPLAELVKIDPKSIGVGQYQHDVNQQALKKSLDDVVVSCVNAVGVEVNTASEQILTYVSGLGPQLARNIILFRNEQGAFPSRESLKQVPRFGPKAFEQAGGFLRIRKGVNPLDASAVHPESYPIVGAMARDLGCTVGELLEDASLREKIEAERYVTDKVGMPTLKDILAELAKPGRDPRKHFESVEFAEGVRSISDLHPGMILQGVVTNVAAFGAFVDLGVHQDGLVHVSELSNGYVKNPHGVVKVNQRVTVRILDIDLERNRISLSMKKPEDRPEKKVAKKPEKAKHGKPKDKPKTKPRPFNNPFAGAFGE
jgi:protein Tex